MIADPRKGKRQGDGVFHAADQGAFQTFEKEKEKQFLGSYELQSGHTRHVSHGDTEIKTFDKSASGESSYIMAY